MIQDLVESGEVNAERHTSNETHTSFKDLLLDYDKGNASNNKTDNQASYNTASYTYFNNLSECDLSQDYANVITFHENYELKQVNATTRNQAKVTLQGVSSKPSMSQEKVTYILRSMPRISIYYNLLDQLNKTLAHISILKIL